MEKFKIIKLKSEVKRVKLSLPRDKRSKEEKAKIKLEVYERINSNITPFVTKLDAFKKNKGFVYVYLAFNDFLSSDEVQECIKKISGENKPIIKTVSEDEHSLILQVKTENIDTDKFKRQEKYLSHFKVLNMEPKIFQPENYADAYKQISKEEFKDDLTIKEIIIVLNNLTEISSYFKQLQQMKLFEELRIVSELGLLFGTLKKSTDINLIRNQDYVACAYLKDFDNLPNPYSQTNGKTKKKVEINYDERELFGKPGVCVIDCGITSDFKILEEKKLPYLNDDLLDHGTQVASLVVAAKDMLDNKERITQEYNLYSYKICDGKKENIIEGLVNGIKLFRNKTNLFILSYNFYYRIPTILLHYLSKRIDNFLHLSNAIVIVSTGNNDDVTIKDAVDFNYLNKNPILFPSNCKNIFSTGALLKYDSPKMEIAPYTRYHPYFPDLEHRGEEYFILKPNIYVFGGGETIDKKEKYYLQTISSDRCLVKNYGTSFANGLLGYYFLKLIERSRRLENCEAYKALVLASGNLDILKDREEGSFKISLNSLREFESEIKHVLLVDEHKANLNNYRRDQTSQNSEELEFYVDAEKIEKIQVFIVHSNNFILNPYTQSLIYFNIRLIEPNQNKSHGKYSTFGDRSKWSTFGKCTPVQVAEYHVGKKNNKIKAQIGNWKLQILPTRKNIPTDEEVVIRWGVVIKLIPRRDYEDKMDEIYDEIMEKTKGVTKVKGELLGLPTTQEQEA